MPTIPLPPPTFYTCPGERHAISRAVHQARLSRSYAGCRDCPHRDDAGLVPLSRLPRAMTAPARGLRLTADGVRGRYLNDLTRQHAQQWATALAVLLWNNRPLTGRVRPEHDEPAEQRPTATGPAVAVGYDERPMSPDLAMGIVTGLRQSGCRVIDVGQTTAPAWRYAAEELQTDAGVYVTGAGCDTSWTGFDFLGTGRLPLDPQRLAELVGESRTRLNRPTRFAGSVKTFAAWEPYAESLTMHFHALRPLTVAVTTPSALQARLVTALFAALPCRLQLDGPGIISSSDIRVAFDEDGAGLTVFNEHGVFVPPTVWQPWLLTALQDEQPGSQAITHSAGLPEFVARLRSPAVTGGIDPQGRLWHGGERPACDAVLTLAALLRTLSWSDAPLSERLEIDRKREDAQG